MVDLSVKLKHTLLVTLISGLFFAVSFINIPIADRLADQYFSESIKAATIAYATIRGVNAVVSVVKESQLELAPAGVGVTIAVGQILDPIDDMTERLSSVLVAAISSLGIQKIGYEVSQVISFKSIAILLLLAIPLIWLHKIRVARSLLHIAMKLCLILLLLRFLLPVSALVSNSIYSHWLEPTITDSMQKLAIVSQQYDQMSNMAPEQDQSFFFSMTSNAADKAEDTRKAFLNVVENAENIINSLLTLMTAYLTIFAVQVLLLPLCMLWLLAALFKSQTLDEFTAAITGKLVPLNQA